MNLYIQSHLSPLGRSWDPFHVLSILCGMQGTSFVFLVCCLSLFLCGLLSAFLRLHEAWLPSEACTSRQCVCKRPVMCPHYSQEPGWPSLLMAFPSPQWVLARTDSSVSSSPSCVLVADMVFVRMWQSTGGHTAASDRCAAAPLLGC